MHDDNQLVDVFLYQAEELFEKLEECFLGLNDEVNKYEYIKEIFRIVHTIKGGSGVLGIERVEKLSHATETLLGMILESKSVINSDQTSVLIRAFDRIKHVIDSIRDNGLPVPGDDFELICQLNDQNLNHLENTDYKRDRPESISFTVDDRESSSIQRVSASNLGAKELNKTVDSFILDEDTSVSSRKQNNLLRSIKVNVGLLDNLMNLVSEMVLARNRLLSFSKSSGDLNFLNTVRNIDVITMGLQERMMMTRMQPIRNIWASFPKLVRDLARETDKHVDLKQIGSETELDSTLLEHIRDPLTHIIRNCIDHGIEPYEIRSKLEKPLTGTITLKAFHDKGMIVVEVEDDGSGLDLQKITKRAIQMDLISGERIRLLSEREIIDLIYTPGFSTKDTISTISGRGVGMDVVKTNVHDIGGTVEIISSKNVGTKIRLRIPLTLAIMPAVFVRCSDQQFAVPQSNVVEMVRHQPEMNKPGVEDFCGVPVLRLRERLIPIVYLNKELGIISTDDCVSQELNIVVVQAAGVCFGLVADEILFMQDIVVKSVGPLLKGTPIYSGTTILGDGRVSLILDISGLAIRSGLISKLLEIDFKSMISEEASQIRDEDDSFLLFDLHGLDRVAIPLGFVTRLESINVNDIYQRGSKDVVMYNDQIMQLIWLDDFVDGAARESLYADRQIPVIVYYNEQNPIGFVVKQIFDIFHTTSDVTISGPVQKGIVGSAVINESLVSFLNIQDIISQVEFENKKYVDARDHENVDSYGIIVSKK